VGVPLVPVETRVPCIVVKRLNRFVVLARTPWGEERVHINNTGRLVGVLREGAPGFCRPLRRPRKLRYRLFSVEYHGGYAIIDTGLQEEAFAEAVRRGVLPWLRGCSVSRRAPRIGGLMLDYELSCGGRSVFVETKSAVLEVDGLAAYPDCPSERGREHIRLLMSLAGSGVRVVLVFIAAFPSARGFMPYAEGDPVIADLVAEAVRRGVEVRSIGLEYNPGMGAVVLYSPDLPVFVGGGDRCG